jgi:hypothetical protein
MKIKVNDFVKNEVSKAGKSKIQIAKDVGISRNQLTNILAEPEMEIKYVVKIGKSIRHDFTKDIPQMSNFITSDDGVEYETLNNSQLRNELLELQRKHSQLQDDYIKTLKDLLDCQRLVTSSK